MGKGQCGCLGFFPQGNLLAFFLGRFVRCFSHLHPGFLFDENLMQPKIDLPRWPQYAWQHWHQFPASSSQPCNLGGLLSWPILLDWTNMYVCMYVCIYIHSRELTWHVPSMVQETHLSNYHFDDIACFSLVGSCKLRKRSRQQADGLLPWTSTRWYPTISGEEISGFPGSLH